MPRVTPWMAWFGLMLTTGCIPNESHPPVQPAAEPVAVGAQFNATKTGRICGQATWGGVVPAVPPYEVRTWVLDPKLAVPRPLRANPHAPAIDRDTHSVAGAVIFLTAVDPNLSRPWDHAPVVVEHRDRLLEVVQGDKRGRIGFVRRGDAITMVSHEKEFNAMHADGAAFFTLTFPEAEQPLTRSLPHAGLIELSSNAGWYWMRAHLFVADHPYFTLTDAQGRFELNQVPPGRYQLVCWMPNWHEARQERDPESGLVTRVAFQPPMEQQCQVVVDPCAAVTADFVVQAELFKR
jgi:hypothetical protein